MQNRRTLLFLQWLHYRVYIGLEFEQRYEILQAHVVSIVANDGLMGVTVCYFLCTFPFFHDFLQLQIETISLSSIVHGFMVWLRVGMILMTNWYRKHHEIDQKRMIKFCSLE
jgi:hypothetical protein